MVTDEVFQHQEWLKSLSWGVGGAPIHEISVFGRRADERRCALT